MMTPFPFPSSRGALLLWLAAALATPLAHATPPNRAVEAARADVQQGRYQAAAARGLKDLLAQPWNHELRLLVADSLARSGDAAAAAVQFDALEGTPLAQVARERRLLLAPGLPAPAHAPGAGSVAGSSVAGSPILQPPPPGPAVPVGRLPQFVYVPPGAPQAGASGDDGRSPAAQAVAALGLAGKYDQAATEGLALIRRERIDPALQLQIANALAWTGRLDDALKTYRGLLDGEQADAARVGTANVLRWRGRDAEAAPLYRAVLARSPGDTGALEGLDLAMRELRPRTTVVLGAQQDSIDMQRKSASVQQRWRHGPAQHLVELEAGMVQDRLPTTAADQTELTMRYHAHTLPWTPVFDASVAGGAGLFGGVRARPFGDDSVLEVARVNWGRLANNPNGLNKELSATLLGAETGRATPVGQLSGRLQHYKISDGNQIITANLRLGSDWRPLGQSIKPFAGIEVRDARFNTADYWSPAVGSGVAYAGLQADTGNSDWNLHASAQAGARLYGDAGTSWSLSLGGRRWIASDLALTFSLWSMASQRDNAAYRARSGSVSVEKLW